LGNLDLSSATTAYTNLTTGTSACSDKYVVPCDSGSSLLYLKVQGTAIPSGCGAKMPVGGSLSGTQVTAIKDWIDQGAAQ
jgi:hypothetical protein